MPSRKLAISGARFDPVQWRNSVIAAVEGAVRGAALKAHESAVEDAPVRDVFKHGSAYRRRGLRTRKLTLEEADSEASMRRRLGLAEATPGVSRTRGRGVTHNPFLRRAGTRKGNPNAFAPTLLSPAGLDEDGVRVPARRGGREVDVRGGRATLRHHPTAADTSGKSPLHARGRFELRTGRALFKAKKASEATLGGRLRGEIRIQGPHRVGSIIKARVLSPTPYAKYNEFGTRHMRATPYMRPAILKLITSYHRDMVKALNNLHRAKPDAGNF